MEFGIDFDYASRCWMANKKSKGKGYYVYICNYIHSNGKRCRRTIYNNIIRNDYKSQFNNYEYKNMSHHINAGIYCKRHLNRKKLVEM